MLESLMLPRCDDPAAWIEQNLRMSADSSPNCPGAVSLARQPWSKQILLDALDPEVEQIWLVMAAQVGKTALCMFILSLLQTFMPRPAAWALPDKDMAKFMSEKRFQPFLKDNPCLSAGLQQDGWDLLTWGATKKLHFYGAKNPDKMAMNPIAYVVMDEEAKYVHERKREAHPVHLLADRTMSYPVRKIIHASTPSTPQHVFWKGFERSSQSAYFVPCPACGEMQPFEFSRETLVWTGKTVDDARNTAVYVCRRCGRRIANDEKYAMMAAGEWRDGNPAASRRYRGYHINALYSRFFSFGQFAAAFVEAHHENAGPESYQNFVNSLEAKPFTVYSYRTKDADVLRCRRAYRRGEIPVDWYHYIAVGYDPGLNETHWVAAAVTRGGAMYVIDWGTIVSFAADDGEGGGAAAHFGTLEWVHGEKKVKPDFAYMDSGDWTEKVYWECMRGAPFFVATKGSSATWGTYKMASPPNCPGIQLLTYVDYSVKRSFYGEAMERQQGARFYVPEDVDGAFVQGLSGQMLLTLPNGRKEWKKLPADHYGDCCKLVHLSWWTWRDVFEPPTAKPADVREPGLLTAAE